MQLLIKYVAIGGASFAIDLGILSLLHIYFHFALLVSTAIAFWIALGFNFLTNRVWFAEEQTPIIRHLLKYMILVGFNFAATLLIVGSFTNHGVNFAVAKTAATCLTVMWNFFLYKSWVFR